MEQAASNYKSLTLCNATKLSFAKIRQMQFSQTGMPDWYSLHRPNIFKLVYAQTI